MFLNSHITFFLIRLELKRKYVHTLSFLLALIPANPEVIKTFFSLIYINVTIPYFLYPLEKQFATYFELIGSKYNFAQFHCLDLDLWLANFKIFVSNFVWKDSVRLVDALQFASTLPHFSCQVSLHTDDLSENFGENIAQKWKKSTSCWRASLKKSMLKSSLFPSDYYWTYYYCGQVAYPSGCVVCQFCRDHGLVAAISSQFLCPRLTLFTLRVQPKPPCYAG